MNPIKKNGNYFIKDAEISDTQNDKFKHIDIANNIINIIENNTTPFNIAIVGKWGLGKSSLINIVKQHFNGKREYIIEDINAWKYEKEALKRVLLRKTLYGLGYTDKKALTELINNLSSHKGQINEESQSLVERFKAEWLPLIINAIIIYVIGVFFSIIGQCILSKINVSEFDFKAWISFVLNGFVSNFYIPLLAVLFERFINSTKGKHSFKITPPITSVDEYERELEDRLTKGKYKDKKIIVIVDDLDRLTPNKIVEALDAIKAFVGYPNFIFIVPFDDTILKEAIKREKTNFVYNEHLTIESDLFLDKLFQYRITLPNIIQSNLPQYAIEAAQKEAQDLVQLCGKEDFELICKEILVHKKVTTPRQVKKIINTFANNLLLGYRREMNGVSEGVFTSLSGKRFLAKMSVLQADFPSFYSNLFIDNDIIDQFLRLTDSEKIEKIDNELLLPYFSLKDKHYMLNKTGESLSMFLHRTSAITTSSIARFLYLNDDRLSELFGNEFSSTIRDGLTSGEYKLVREKIEDNLDKNVPNLLYEVLSNSDSIEFEFCCIGIINVSDIEYIKNDTRLLSLVNNRLLSVFKSNNVIRAKNLNLVNAIDIFKLHNDFIGFDKLILNQFISGTEDIVENISVFFEKEDVLSESVKSHIKKLIAEKCSTSETKLTFEDLFNIESLDIDSFFEEYLSGLFMFERLYNELVSSENYDPENTLVVSFIKLFEKHIQNNNADEVLKIVEPNLNSSEFVELLINSMASNSNLFKQIDVISAASIKLIEVANDNISNSINLWLSTANWKIPFEQSDIVDKYLAESLMSENINRILLNIANKNQVDLIPDTIKSINNLILDQKIEISTLYELQKQYDENQMTDLIEKLKSAFVYSNLDVDMLSYATGILKAISVDKNNEKYITSMADYIYSQNSSQPVKMLNKIVMMAEFKVGISTAVAKKFITWSGSNIGSYPMSSVNLFNIFKNDILKTEYITYSDKIMKNVTQDTLELSLELLRDFRTEFEQGNSINTTYRNFLINNLSNNHCRKAIMNDMVNYFTDIENIDEFICETIKYDDVNEESIQAISKFTISCSPEEIKLLVQNILASINLKNISNAKYILSGWLGAKYDLVIAQILEAIDDSISINLGLNLLKLSISMEKIELPLKINLVGIMLEMSDDTVLPEILAESKKMGRLTKNIDKRRIGTFLYNAFRNTAQENIKKQIFSLVQELGTKTAFELDEEKNKREFSDEEKMLFKRR